MTDPTRSPHPLRPTRARTARAPAGDAPGCTLRELDPPRADRARPPAKTPKARATARTWHAWIAIHRVAGDEPGSPLAQSRRYEFRLPAGPGEWRAAHAALLRQWVDEGEPLAGDAGLCPDDPSLRLYETLQVVLDDVWCLEYEAPLRRAAAREPAGDPFGADAPVRSWSAGLPELWSPNREPTP